MIDTNIQTINITNFVKEKFPEADAALLTGSYATKEMKKNSDIDLIIFSESISQSFVEKILYDSKKIDIIYLSTHYNYLLKELYSDILLRYGVYGNMISNSRILFDKKNILKDLIYFSKNVLIKEYEVLNSEEIKFKIKLISNALEDIEDIESVGEFYFSSSLIVEEATNLILTYKSSILGRGKIKARKIEEIDSEFYYGIVNSIMKYDKREFIKIIKEKLEFFGGVLDSYTPKNIPSINSDAYIRYDIVIKKKYYNSGLISTNFFKFIEFLKKNNINLLYYYFQNDYLIITIESIKFDSRLSRNITCWLAFSFKVDTKDKIIIRLSKNKLIPFVSPYINEVLEKDLVYFTEFIKEKQLFKNNLDTLKFSFQLVNKLIDDLFVDNKKNVHEYLYHSNVLNYDNLDSFGFNYYQLIDNRKKIIEELEVMSESLSPFCTEERLIGDYYKSLCFPKIILEMENSDLNMLKNSVFYDNQIDGAKLLVLNYYLKYLLDIINSNNQLSIIANILKKK